MLHAHFTSGADTHPDMQRRSERRAARKFRRRHPGVARNQQVRNAFFLDAREHVAFDIPATRTQHHDHRTIRLTTAMH
ncbi:hypothetical protein A5779_12445 [Mycolicibacterium peregrinum]|uniref:Uncharacterized protein n=1 Tax=Mycolicibacterium peregrinum TaxID=43304 RepID=A0A1A0V8L8_MYCPR|nr:hypothetical protein A5779_12445 [Mycolicibacterium peregrinum]